jgi:hypothetical protein
MRALISALAVGAAAVAVGLAEADVTKERQDILRALTTQSCSGLSWPDAPVNENWTITFTAKQGVLSVKIKAEAELIGANNIVYSVLLTQAACGEGGTPSSVSTSFRLKDNGKGTFTLSAPLVGDTAWLTILLNQDPCDFPPPEFPDLPCHIHTEFVTEQFHH